MLSSAYFDTDADTVVLFYPVHSYTGQQVRLALEEKGVTWISRPLDIDACDDFSPDYVRMNPQMETPTLVDRGRVIRNAEPIIRYIDLRFDGPQLMPDDPELRCYAEQWLNLSATVPLKIITETTVPERTRSQRLAAYQSRLDVLSRLIKQSDNDPALSSLYRRKHAEILAWLATSLNQTQAQNAIAEIEHILDKLDAHLDGHFLADATYSLADVAWAPILHHLGSTLEQLWSNGRRSKVADYIARLTTRPHFKTAIAG